MLDQGKVSKFGYLYKLLKKGSSFRHLYKISRDFEVLKKTAETYEACKLADDK